jgi:hypothetical protein
LGATFFWGAWGYKFDRARLERNLAAMREAGIDYVRVLGSVGGSSWQDRQTDPRWNDYDAIITGLTDLAFDKYGVRVQWTLFGGAPFTPPGRVRISLVDRFAKLARGREHKIFAFEIANEAWTNGFEGAEGLDELRRLGQRLARRTSVLVALSAPASDAACDMYGGAGVDVMTVHYARRFEPDKPLLPLVQPWQFRPHESKCRGQLPRVVFNNEPIGPESSVRQDDDASRIAGAFVMTFLAGNASYVLHSGPGIRGGGAADIQGSLERHANFDELPSFKPIADALHNAKRYLPRGLANWQRLKPDDPSAPIHGSEHVYVASSGSRFIGLVLAADQSTAIRSRRAAEIAIRHASTGKVVQRRNVSPGDDITLTGDEVFVVIGTAR